MPERLLKNTYCVFDIETTGLNFSTDEIIEIGAVKIVNGVFTESFSTFVRPNSPVPENIEKLTGIKNEDVALAPQLCDVIPDFYKFCDGCLLVGHNVTFDYRFVEYYAEQERYTFSQTRYDTVNLAQELLRLSNYKLNTVADYYGFTFNHHRAFDDALTTAKIFIELIKQRKSLPKVE